MPPMSEVLDALRYAVAPAFLSALAIGFLVACLLTDRAASLATALAILAGLAAGNHFREVFDYRTDPDTPLQLPVLGRQFLETLTHAPVKQPEGDPLKSTDSEAQAGPPSGRYWLPWAVLLATIVGLVSRVPIIPDWARTGLRAGMAMVAATVLIPRGLPGDYPWLPHSFVVVVFLNGLVLEKLADEPAKGLPALAASLACGSAAVVLLHAHSARLSDGATLLGAGLGGVAIASQWGRANAAGAMPALSVLLPGILLSGWRDTFSEVPAWSFLLPAVAPIILAVLWLPGVRRLGGWPRWVAGVVVALIPAILAVVLAARAEPLDFSATH